MAAKVCSKTSHPLLRMLKVFWKIFNATALQLFIASHYNA
jgi:hypothetical protein